MKELKDTVYMMNSEDYKNRFKAEYWQTKIRYEKLKAFNTKIEAAEMTKFEKKSVEEPKHDCPAYLLRDQQSAMGNYLHVLETRAVIEGIDLDDFVYSNIVAGTVINLKESEFKSHALDSLVATGKTAKIRF